MHDEPYYTGDTSIVEPALILMGYLVALIIILIFFKWELSGPMGVLLLVLQESSQQQAASRQQTAGGS